jgi:hypothetical protein
LSRNKAAPEAAAPDATKTQQQLKSPQAGQQAAGKRQKDEREQAAEEQARLEDKYRLRPTDKAVLQQRILPGGAKAQVTVMRSLTDIGADARFSAQVIPRGFLGLQYDLEKRQPVNVASVEPIKDKDETVITLDVPVLGKSLARGLWTKGRFVVAACKEANRPPTMLVTADGRVSSWWYTGLVMGAFLLGFYTLVIRFQGAPRNGHGCSWNPLYLTVAEFGPEAGRASLSKLQIYFFTLVVAALLSYILLRTGLLLGLSEDVLWLLGIGGAGTAAAKVAAVNRQRIGYENWAWLKNKGWVSEPAVLPSTQDLFTTDGRFDVFKFQMMVFSLIVAVALLTSGFTGLAEFQIPAGLLGLLGLSQVLYVGGKVVASPTVTDVDNKVTELRKLELALMNKLVADAAWKTLAEADRTLARAAECAPAEYATYWAEAEVAATMIQEAVPNGRRPADLAPALPARAQPVIPVAPPPLEQGAGQGGAALQPKPPEDEGGNG